MYIIQASWKYWKVPRYNPYCIFVNFNKNCNNTKKMFGVYTKHNITAERVNEAEEDTNMILHTEI